jgi:hypothetical protein
MRLAKVVLSQFRFGDNETWIIWDELYTTFIVCYDKRCIARAQVHVLDFDWIMRVARRIAKHPNDRPGFINPSSVTR